MRTRRSLVGLALVAFLSPPAFGQTPAQANATKKLYLALCAKCHGPTGIPRPIAKDARRFIDPAWAPPIEQVKAVIVSGKGEEMPKFKARLSEQQVAALAEFVLTLKSLGTK